MKYLKPIDYAYFAVLFALAVSLFFVKGTAQHGVTALYFGLLIVPMVYDRKRR